MRSDILTLYDFDELDVVMDKDVNGDQQENQVQEKEQENVEKPTKQQAIEQETSFNHLFDEILNIHSV